MHGAYRFTSDEVLDVKCVFIMVHHFLHLHISAHLVIDTKRNVLSFLLYSLLLFVMSIYSILMATHNAHGMEIIYSENVKPNIPTTTKPTNILLFLPLKIPLELMEQC